MAKVTEPTGSGAVGRAADVDVSGPGGSGADPLDDWWWLEASPQPHVIYTPVRDQAGSIVDFEYAAANAAACAFENTAREQLVGRRLLAQHPSAVEQGAIDLYIDLLTTGEPFTLADVAYPLESLEGETRFFDLQVVKIGDAVSQTWHDVTDRHAALTALADSEATYRLVAENSSDVVFRGKINGDVQWISESLHDVLGWRPADVVGHPLREFLAPDALPTISRIGDDLAKGQTGHGEVRVRAASGGYRWMNANLRPILDEAGVVIGQVGGLKDITDEVSYRRGLAMLTAGNRIAGEAKTEFDLLTRICQAAADVGGYAFAWYGTPAADAAKTVRVVAVAGDDRGYMDSLHVTWDEAPTGLGPTGTCIRTGRTVVSNDHAADPQFAPWFHEADALGIHGSVALPVVVDGTVHGALSVYATESGGFGVREIASLERLATDIGDGISRLRAAADLAASEERFRMIVENATDIVFHQVDGIVEWVSPSVESITGWAPNELIGRTSAHLWHPDDRAAAVALRDATYEGRPGSGIFRWQRKDGAYLWMEAKMQPYPEPDGRVGAVGIVRDITEQHLAAESLAASEARYRLIAENASDVVIRSDVPGVISWVSPSITGVLGWSPEEVIGRSPASLIHPDDVSSVVESQQRTLAAGSNRGEAEVRYATRDGNWRWVRVTGKALRDTDGTLIGGIDTLRDIDAEVETRTQLEFEVNHDSLTGLLTRSRLLEQLEKTRSEQPQNGSSSNCALLSIGIDGLGMINDAYTHTAGDRVLVTIAERLTRALKGRGRIGRTADTEIGVLVTDAMTSAELLDLVDELQSTSKLPIMLGQERFAVVMSIGIATDQGGDVGELLRDASNAMRQASEAGGNRWVFADPALADEARQRLQIQTGLRRALDTGEIKAWYQPIVSLPSGKLRGYEALARWIKADGSVVQPDEFVSVAERSDLIVELDRTMLEQAVTALRDLPTEVDMGVNFSAATLSAPDLVEFVSHSIAAAGVNPRRLHLEVTETSLIHVTDSIQVGMLTLANLGVTWWVDDFGTGYSTLTHLRDMPVQGLKLDRSFTKGITGPDPTVLRLSQGLAGLADGLGLSTIAEGVETQREADILGAQGWEMAQGWLFGKPQPAPWGK